MPLGANKAAIMGVAGVSTADVVLLDTNTITSGTANSAFTSGITSTYGEYIFRFYNVHPATDGVEFQWNGSTDGGSNYNVTKTGSFFRAQANEGDSAADLGYSTGDTKEPHQLTTYQALNYDVDNDNDSSCVGELHIFNPAGTTYVKHYYSRSNTMLNNATTNDAFVGGYMNTTSAINAIDFKMSSGNIDTAVIKMWGVK
jgi:hypothetical protein